MFLLWRTNLSGVACHFYTNVFLYKIYKHFLFYTTQKTQLKYQVGKKRNLMYIIYIHFRTNSEKIHTLMLKTWSPEVIHVNRMSDGHIPMATNPTWTGWVFLTVLVELSLLPVILPTLHFLLRSVCWTFSYVYSSSNISEEHERKTWKKWRSSLFTSVQRSQCLTQHAKMEPNMTDFGAGIGHN